MDLNEINFLEQSNFIENERTQEALDDAIKAWKYIIKKPKLNVDVILHAHKLLMNSRPIPERDKGNWRKQQVWIGNREGKPYYAVPLLMDQWIEASNALLAFTKAKQYESIEASKLEIIEARIKESHVNFETIHPFIDGNGRIGRILLNWQRIRAGLGGMIIEEKDKLDYYKWFE